MTNPVAVNSTPETEASNATESEFSPQWGGGAPKGGKTVLNRILKDGAEVPLFLGQTLVNSLRDCGYNSTTSALCEHVDNAIQWGATEVRVYFHQTGKKGDYRIDALVLDNGQGMAPHVLKVAASFGGSMVFDNREGIGRYGMGMKTAALSMSPILEVYSWQEARAFYNLTLDVAEIGNSRKNLIIMDDPTLHDTLPSELLDILVRPMLFPKNPQDTQTLFATNAANLHERLGESGTIIYMPECDRLSSKKADTLVKHATQEMGRIYRRFIAKGLKLYVNNRRVEAFDPTYHMESARHTRMEGLTVTRSRLVSSWPIDIPIAEGASQTTRIMVRLYALPYEDWCGLSRTVLKNALQVFEDHTVSFIRNDREVEIGSSYPRLQLRKHSDNNWLRLEIDFTGEADEGFGVAANKQGVRIKEYVSGLIVEKIGEEIAALRQAIKEKQAKNASLKAGSKMSEAERRATDAEAFQGKPLPVPVAETETDKAALEQNLRALAVTLKREDEADEQAYERVKRSSYLTTFKHDEYYPFYLCDFKYGKVILTLNTAHAFFQKVWQPLSDLAKTVETVGEGDGDGSEGTSRVGSTCTEVLLAMQALLFSLARTQSLLCAHDLDKEHRQLFDKLRREWSANLETQLKTK